MAEATQNTGKTRTAAFERDRFSKTFRNLLLIGSLCLLLLGGVGFMYLRAKSPLTLFAGSRRPIAAATAFIPKKSPFAFSLLTNPTELINLQQALVRPEWRSQARDEIRQIEQNLLSATGLSFERDIPPWLGAELTFACIDSDLDHDLSNGKQPGYLLALEIAPDQLPLATSFLQLLWQQRALAGNSADIQQVSGIRILSSRASGITTASALVSEQFVMFANDVDVLRQSFQSAQTAQNLAQSADDRRQVESLPAERIGLAYFDSQLLSESLSAQTKFMSSKFVAMSLGLTRNGLILNTGSNAGGSLKAAARSSVARSLLQYLPIANELAIFGEDFSQLPSAGGVAALITDSITLDRASDSWLAFLRSRFRSGQTMWSDANYALARLGSRRASDWLLAIERSAALINELDSAAEAAGYSVVPVEIGDESATAWTRFKTSAGRQVGSGLETEVLGLHLQQGDVEILANSLSAMKTALSAPQNSLLDSSRFKQATDALLENRDTVVFTDWSAISAEISRNFPVVNQIQSMIRPWISHSGAIAANFDQDGADIFIQLSED